MTREETLEIWLASEPEAPPPRRLWAHWVTALLLGVLLGTGATALPAVRLGSGEPVAVSREWPRREIPPEWRWAPQPVKYQHMFRKRR